MKKFDVYASDGSKMMSVFGVEVREGDKSFVVLDKDGNCILVAPNTCLIVSNGNKEETISDKVLNAKLVFSEIEDFTGFTRNIIDNVRKIIQW
jgi:hypothetical protein